MKKTLAKRLVSVALAFSVVLACLLVPAGAAELRTGNDLKVMVLADSHVLPGNMIADTQTYRDELLKNMKLFNESEALLDHNLGLVKQNRADVLIICGDLSKDGDREAHQALAARLNQLKKDMPSLKIYVINGNHDIRNSNGYNFVTNTPSTRTNPSDFRDIYGVTYKDNTIIATYTPSTGEANQLSYVARPREGYTFIAVDSGCYSVDNTKKEKEEHETRGHISEECRAWVLEQIALAKARGDVVIGFLHHGVNPHFSVEPIIMGDFVVDDYEAIATEWADAGMSYVFTGHEHSQDVAAFTSEAGNKLYDVETASGIAYPCATRLVTFSTTKQGTKTVEKVVGKTFRNASIAYLNPQTKTPMQISNITQHSYNKDYAVTAAMLECWVKSIVRDKLGTYPASVEKSIKGALEEFFNLPLGPHANVEKVVNYVYFAPKNGEDNGDNPDWYNEALALASTGYLVDELVRILNEHLATMGADVAQAILEAVLPVDFLPYVTVGASAITLGPLGNQLLTAFVLYVADSMTNDCNFTDDIDFTITYEK